MSTYSFSCHNFVENTWRKGVCSNCFRPKEQHEISVNNNTAYGNNYRQHQRRSGGGGDNILPRINVVGSNTALMTQSQFSHQNKTSYSGGSAAKNVNFCGGSESNNKRRMDMEESRKPNFSVGGPMRSGGKGILKSKEAKDNKGGRSERRNVCFPKEAVEVIGFEDHEEISSSDDEDTPPDPQDNASIAELLEKNSTTLDEKEFYRLTQKNTNFNSIKTNLLGKTNIEIGPIVGGTGGTSKPLVSIGTFETRNEPLKIRQKIDQDSTDDGISSHRKFVQKTSSIPVPPQIKTAPVPIKAMQNVNASKPIVPLESTLKSKFEHKKQDPIKQTVTISSAKDTPKWRSEEDKPESKKEVRKDEKPPIKPKSILKLSQFNTKVNTTLPPILSNKHPEIKPNSSALSNLIILTEGNTIASKRTSFLQDIINGKESSPSSTTIVPINSSSFESLGALEKDSLEVPPALKLNLSLDCKVTNPPKTFNGSQTDSSEFDDSLEDSGLDIKIQSAKEELSEESDEKVSGSGSDSGNENDYTVSNNNNRIKKGHPGLYISVQEEEETIIKVEDVPKLSPDSVLSNSASGSEMSASGSTESIQESLKEEENRRTSTDSNSSSSSKRQAPKPPSITALEQVYDDIANLKSTEEPEEEEESIYDDCSVLTENERTITANNDPKIGSYNFQDDQESSPMMHRSDGIEFIGIRKIDSESFLKERSPTPDRRFPFSRRSISPGKSSRERSSSTSPKTRRKVNQFFSTIGKKAGAAFNNGRNKSPSVIQQDPSGCGDYKSQRSMSTDSVRAQEIYATLTPTSLKFKGVLNKLSKIDMNFHDKPMEHQENKVYKKNGKISAGIKKFLRFGNKESEVDIYNYPPPQMNINLTSSSEESSSVEGSKPIIKAKPIISVPTCKPPPPPPRIHSLDLLHKVGVVNKPARPPPPVRTNKIAPSFTSVFHPEDEQLHPPSKPKRKNSINHSGGVSRDLETSYNHVTNLNLETLKLIAGQPLTKITSNFFPVISPGEKIEWKHFDLCTGMRQEPVLHGLDFAIYPAHFEGTKILLMIQESSTPFQFSCVQTNLAFQDFVPLEFISWMPSNNVSYDVGIKAYISALPFFSIWKFQDFIKSPEVPQKDKLFALLQSLDFWDFEEISNLLVLKHSEILYIHAGISQLNNFPSDFEVSIKQLLFTDHQAPILSPQDKQILLEKVSGAGEEVKSQLKLFFQLKLFSPLEDSQEFMKIRKFRSEHSIQQWLDKERAQCMKEVVERSFFRGNNQSQDSITPLRKQYLEFLMRNSAKAILDIFVELFE